MAESRRAKEASLAALRRLELEEKAGTLVNRARVVKAAADAGAILRQSLERLGVQLSPQFAAESDALVIRNRLESAIADALADAEASLRRMAGPPPAE